MLSANFKPKRTAAASRGFLATARLFCCHYLAVFNYLCNLCNVIYVFDFDVQFKLSKLWCAAQQTPPPCCHVAKGQNSNFITFSVARWQHRTARRPQSNQIAMAGDNKLTLTRWLVDPNWPKIESGRPVVTPHLPWKFHANRSSRFLVMLLTKKQTVKQRNRTKTIPRLTGGAVKILLLCLIVVVRCFLFFVAPKK